MTRLGWSILAVILVGIALFSSMLSFGVGSTRRSVANAVREVADRVDPRPVDVVHVGRLAVPVLGISAEALRSTFGEARDGGERRHGGIDIAAPAGTPVVAAAAGRVEKLFFSQGGGGITAYVRSMDGRWSYYYAHLAGYAPGLAEGQTVAPGTPIGFVGDTGNSGTGNYHLHFGVSRMQPGEPWSGGRAVDPHPLLAGRGGSG